MLHCRSAQLVQAAPPCRDASSSGRSSPSSEQTHSPRPEQGVRGRSGALRDADLRQPLFETTAAGWDGGASSTLGARVAAACPLRLGCGRRGAGAVTTACSARPVRTRPARRAEQTIERARTVGEKRDPDREPGRPGCFARDRQRPRQRERSGSRDRRAPPRAAAPAAVGQKGGQKARWATMLTRRGTPSATLCRRWRAGRVNSPFTRPALATETRCAT